MQYVYSIRFAIVGAFAVGAAAITAITMHEQPPTITSMQLQPTRATVVVGETFDIAVEVQSPQAVNAFSGELVFANDLFEVAAISYNTSIADLWVEEPWYSRADNSVYFAGGTTARGGFVGRGTLLTVTLRAKEAGDVALALKNVRLLLHDGLGTDATVVPSIDAVFTANASSTYQFTPSTPASSQVSVAEQLPDPDLNGDGVINFFDIGILITQLGGDDMRYDLDGDGSVNTRDFNRIRDAR